MSKQPNNNYTAVQLAILAFLTYACVYAFRKPFTIAEYKGVSFGGISYQTLLIISQATGYLLSKFTGIKVISELEKRRRLPLFIFLILMAWFSLFMLAIIPPPFGIFCLLINGYSLGFTWGIVFSYVEGRKMTDLIGAIMAVSFIFSGGFTRTIAVAIKAEWKLEEQWIGFISGMFFLIPLLFLIFLLDKMPVPSLADIADRKERMPMFLKDRREFLKFFGIGLTLIVFSYILLTVMRDIRDNYMFSIWSELGYGKHPALFTLTESITSIVVLCLMAMIVLIRDHYRAYILSHWVVIAGFLVSACASILFKLTLIDGALWMQLIGLGLYAGYIPFNCILFERFISAFRVKGNVGFLIYYADSFGYFGSLLIMIVKEWMRISIQWVDFYLILVGVVSTAGILSTLFSIRFFGEKYKLIV